MNIKLDAEIYLPDLLNLRDTNVLPVFSCLNANLGGILNFCGHKRNVDFMLSRQFNFYYTNSKDGMYFNCNLFNFFFDFNLYDQINIIFRYHVSIKELTKTLENYLSKSIPVLLIADQYYIPGYIYYKKYHGIHYPIITGINNNEFILNDITGSSFISIVDLEKSANPYNYGIVTFSFSESEIKYGKSKIESLINRNVNYGLNYNEINLSKENQHDFNKELNGKIIYPGVSGIRKLANDIWNLFQEEYQENINNIMSSFSDRTYEIIVQRYWHIMFLESSKRLLTNKKVIIDEIILDIRKLVHDWKVIKNIFHKANVRNNVRIINRVKERLLVIADFENDILTKMQNLFN